MNSLKVFIYLGICCAAGQSLREGERKKRQVTDPPPTSGTAQGTGTQVDPGLVDYLLQAQNNINTAANNPVPQITNDQVSQNTNNQVPQYTNNQVPQYTNNQVPLYTNNLGPQYTNFPGPQYTNYQGPQYTTNPQQQMLSPYQQLLNYWMMVNGIYFPPLQAGNGFVTARDGRDGTVATAAGTVTVDGMDMSFSPFEW